MIRAFMHQWSQIRSGDAATLRRKARTAVRLMSTLPLFVATAIWAVPAVAIVRLLRPWVHIRMAILESSRIGHFTLDACVFLAMRSLQAPADRTVDLFGFREPTCNEQWARMVRRQLFVRWWVRPLALFNRRIPGGEAHELIPATSQTRRDSYAISLRSSARFEFTAEEEERAKAWLRRKGWRDGEPFVCLLVRDSAYLDSHALHAAARRWDYHSYRDSKIETYVDAVQALVDRGYWVIRLGQIAHEPLPLRHPRIVDYPFLSDQEDLLDIWLAVKCSFFVSTALGIDITAAFYGKPVVFVNALPLSLAVTSINHIWVPKHLSWSGNGRPLTLREHCEHRYVVSEDYAKAGITIEDLSPADITAAVIEGEQRFAGTWVVAEADEDRQRRYWKAFRAWPDFERYHSYVHPGARVGSAWLRSRGDAFFE